MEERVVKVGPGVLIGISMAEPEFGFAMFYDGRKLRTVVDLENVERLRFIKGSLEPGYRIDMFFRKAIIMKYPKGVEIDVMTD